MFESLRSNDVTDVKVDPYFLDRFKKLVNALSVEIRKDFEVGTHDFLAKPRKSGKHPAIILIHDAWGLNEHIQSLAIRLAEQGYATLAVDLFKGETTHQPRVAKTFMDCLDPDSAMRIIMERLEKLSKAPYVRADRIATVGILYGGYYSLLLGAKVPKLAAVLTLVGRFPGEITAQTLQSIKAPVFVCAGKQGIDTHVVKLNSFMLKYMQEKSKAYLPESETLLFDNAKSGFFDELHASSYDPHAAGIAWENMIQFLKKHTGKEDKTTRFTELRKHFGKLGGKILDSVEDDTSIGGKIFDLFEDAAAENKEEKDAKASPPPSPEKQKDQKAA